MQRYAAAKQWIDELIETMAEMSCLPNKELVIQERITRERHRVTNCVYRNDFIYVSLPQHPDVSPVNMRAETPAKVEYLLFQWKKLKDAYRKFFKLIKALDGIMQIKITATDVQSSIKVSFPYENITDSQVEFQLNPSLYSRYKAYRQKYRELESVEQVLYSVCEERINKVENLLKEMYETHLKDKMQAVFDELFLKSYMHVTSTDTKDKKIIACAFVLSQYLHYEWLSRQDKIYLNFLKEQLIEFKSAFEKLEFLLYSAREKEIVVDTFINVRLYYDKRDTLMITIFKKQPIKIDISLNLSSRTIEIDNYKINDWKTLVNVLDIWIEKIDEIINSKKSENNQQIENASLLKRKLVF